MYDLGIMNGNVYVDGSYHETNVYISDGKIACLSEALLPAKECYDAKFKKVLPGIIDPHVHFELGGGQYCSSDDFYSGSVSAAYGGITMFIDFLDPVNCSKDLKGAFNKRKQLAKKSILDYSFHATIKDPKGEVEFLIEEMERLQLPSVKLFTAYSDSGRRTYDEEIIKLLQGIKDKDMMILAHIEADEMIDLDKALKPSQLLESRCTKAETSEALKLAGFVKQYGGKIYMVHLSSGKTLEELVRQYGDILNKDFIIESCPHYFYFSSDNLSGENGYRYTMAPPLRTSKEVEQLKALSAYIATIGTDHCPFTLDEKNKKSLVSIPMGIGGVEHSFRLLYTMFGDNIIDKMSLNPAKVHGLYPRKGIIQEGSDADLFIYNPEGKFVIKEDHSRCDYSVYDGITVKGQIESTLCGGQFVIKHGQLKDRKGEYITRSI